jgi:hypothetical protein
VQRQRALRELRSLVRRGGARGRRLLADVTRRQLAGRRPEERWEAIESLASFAYRGDAASRSALLLATAAANGGLAPPIVAPASGERATAALLPLIQAADRHAAAFRDPEAGVVILRGLVDPRGRIIHTEPVDADQSAALVDAVRYIYAGGVLPPIDLGDARTAPYMWIALPPVTFTAD